MTKNFLNIKCYIVLLCASIFFLNGCQENFSVEFEQTKSSSSPGLTSIIEVSEYHLICNPKSTSSLVITLADNAEYTANNLTTSELSTLLCLFNSGKVQYDTKTKELRANNVLK